MLPFNADNLQDDESAAPPPEDPAATDDTGEEVAPTLSTEAVEALNHLAGPDDAETAHTERAEDTA